MRCGVTRQQPPRSAAAALVFPRGARVLECTKGQTHALCLALAAADECVSYVFAEVLRDKVVDEGVDAAVEAGQAQGDDVEVVAGVTYLGKQEAVVHQQHDVTGTEAHQEHDQHGDDQQHRLASFLGDGLVCHGAPQGLEHQHVGHHAHRRRNYESQDAHGQEVAGRQLPLVMKGDVMARNDVHVADPHRLVVQEEGRG